MRVLGKYQEWIYGLMRIVVGVLFTCHGAQKVFGAFGGIGVAANTEIMIAGWLELVLGVLVTVGLFTGIAAFVASGEMAVAYFQAHASGGFWPIVNHGEPAVLYCFIFLYIAAHGAGALGIDTAIKKST
jgi:putative oxidoreductase